MKTKLLILSLLCALAANSQTNTNVGWESFFKNDRATARNFFTKLATKPANADEANVALCMMAQMDKSLIEGFSYLNQLSRTSKNPLPYLMALWSDPVNYSGKLKSQEQLEFYRKLSERTDVDGALNAMAFSLLGRHYEKSKQYEQADQYYSKIGELENWLITGEYENISTSGFDKSYEVLEHPELEFSFTGKNNRQFNWRTVPYTRHDKWFDFTYYNSYENALQFAQTFINSPAALNAQLRIGVSGSVKVWVNDQLLITEPEERNNDLDAYVTAVKLNQGYNRVLVQIGESYAGRSNFMLRITDQKGIPLNNLSTTSTPKPYVKESTFISAQIKSPGFKYFEDALKVQPQSYLNQLMLAKMYLRLGNLFEARILLEKLKNRFPQSTYVNLMLIDLFNKADNRTGVETLQEEIKTHDPECAIAVTLLYNEYDQQNDYVNANLMISKLEKIYGEDEAVLLKKLNITGKQKNQPELINMVEQAYPKYLNSGDITNLKYLIESQIRKNPNAIAILQKYINENDDYKGAKYVAKLFLDKGETDAALAIYEKELKNDPIGFGIYTDLAEIYYRLQQYDQAEKLYLKALEIDPNSAFVYSELGLLYETRKQKENSIKAYQKSLKINPNNYDAIESLRRIEDKKPVFDYFEQPDVKKIVSKALSRTEYPDDHILTLNNEVQKVVYENGGSEEKHFYTAKVLTQTGLESFKEYDIPYTSDQNYKIEVAEVIKASGTKVPAEIDGNQLVFTNLEIGDILNIRYKIKNYHVGAMSSHFWDSFYFSNGLPYLNTKYSLLIHHNKAFKHVFSKADIAPEKTKQDEFDLYVWQQSGQHALRYEDKMPPLDDVANILYLSTIPDWEFIAEWYDNIASAKARGSYEIKKTVNELFDGRRNLDQLSKIKMIYNYITTNIAYSSVSFRQSGIVPQNPSTVINTRIGDCKDVSTLFVSMCKEAGINASLALVNTKDRGQHTMLLPSIEFNHCIAKATIDGQDFWVELTSGSLPFNTFDNTFLGSNVLEINGDTKQLIKFNPAKRDKNIMDFKTVVKLDNADMIIKERNWNTGSMSSYLRSVFADLSSNDQVKKMKEQLAGIYPDNEIYELKFSNLIASKKTSDTVGTESSYKLINVNKSVAGMSIFSIPWSNKSSATALQIVSPRKFGIDLSQLFALDESNQELSLELPIGKTLVQPLKTVKLSNDFADFSLVSTQVGNKIRLTRSFTLKQNFVPVDKIDTFKAFYKEMTEADEQQLAMK
jgi:tetratricopeptide (TPR) repeat protein